MYLYVQLTESYKTNVALCIINGKLYNQRSSMYN